MSRHHVHLSSDRSTAKNVGQRHGKPIVFKVAAGTMYKDGFVFYCSANQVWLVDRVPPEYLEISEDSKT
jgi:putative RNA 2'-phosphotransferase